MKVMTNELIGDALDSVVARCEGWSGDFIDMPNYSTDWRHGGPIIEREKLDVRAPTIHCEYWTVWAMEYSKVHQQGPTPLIAAMLCYVVSKLGDTVDVPDELFNKA